MIVYCQCDSWLLMAGMSCAQGRGVVKDESKAVQWYAAAATQGFAHAQFNLGMCVARGTTLLSMNTHTCCGLIVHDRCKL
jgi:TPR repeat protein